MSAHVIAECSNALPLQMSGKFMSRLNKYANSMSRFLRGDDDSPSSPRQSAVDPLARAFTDIDAQKAAFFRTPSKARVGLASLFEMDSVLYLYLTTLLWPGFADDRDHPSIPAHCRALRARG